jgi:hypothetical protein
MKHKPRIFLVLLVAAGFASAKPKHPSLPEVFETAKTVHVETLDTRDITDISLDPETRNAILDVQDAIQDWGRYSLSRSRRDADLIFVIYKGRLTRDPNDTPTLGIPRSSNSPISHSPIQNPADASQGPNSSNSPDGFDRERDELKVYSLDANGKLKNLLWHNEQVRGFDAPNLILLQQLEREIDKAYPNPPATSQSNP